MQFRIVTLSGEQHELTADLPSRLPLQHAAVQQLRESGGTVCNLTAGDSPVTLRPRSRKSISVNQSPGGGSNYPFVRPSEDVRQLLGDFYLSFERREVAVTRLSVACLFGFGDSGGTPPAGFSPTHPYDILVESGSGETVFDSCDADFVSRPWTDRMQILEWRTALAVCRCVQYLSWTLEDYLEGRVRQYNQYITVENGELDARTWAELPARVRSIRVGNAVLRGAILLDSGYNCSLQEPAATAADLTAISAVTVQASDTLIAGRRLGKSIILTASPGDGLGRYPGCEENEQPGIKSLAAAVPDSHGNVSLDATECFRVMQPLLPIRSLPQQYQYDTVSHPPEGASSSLQLCNDCGPCCDCSYFVRVYAGVRRQWDLWKELAGQAGNARDLLVDLINRWNAAKSALGDATLHTDLQSTEGGVVTLSTVFCNQSGGTMSMTQCCYTVTASQTAKPLGKAKVIRSSRPGLQNVAAVAVGNEFCVPIGDVPRGSAAKVTLSLCFDGLTDGSTISVRTTITTALQTFETVASLPLSTANPFCVMKCR